MESFVKGTHRLHLRYNCQFSGGYLRAVERTRKAHHAFCELEPGKNDDVIQLFPSVMVNTQWRGLY